VLFFAGDAEASAEAEVEVDFLVEAVLFFEVEVPLVVVPVDVAVVSSFFWVWQPRNAVSVSAVIKDKTDVFIGLVKLTKVEDVALRDAGQALKWSVFSLQICKCFL
jgi:hypothetical protein